MPEEQPLQTLTALEGVREAEVILGVGLLEEVEELGGGFHDGEGGRLAAIEEDGDAAVGVEAQEPFVFLDVGGYVADEGVSLVKGDREGVCSDVHDLGGPFGAVHISELF